MCSAAVGTTITGKFTRVLLSLILYIVSIVSYNPRRTVSGMLKMQAYSSGSVSGHVNKNNTWVKMRVDVTHVSTVTMNYNIVHNPHHKNFDLVNKSIP